MSGDRAERPPAAAMVLGLAGLLPVAGVAVLLAAMDTGAEREPAAYMLALPALGYAALILSFLGGMWWSAACNRLRGAPLWTWLGLAVVPSLWAAASFSAEAIAPLRGPAVLLAAGLLLALAVDRVAVRAGLLPRWWMRLRVPLSCGLALETLVVGWLG